MIEDDMMTMLPEPLDNECCAHCERATAPDKKSDWGQDSKANIPESQ